MVSPDPTTWSVRSTGGGGNASIASTAVAHAATRAPFATTHGAVQVVDWRSSDTPDDPDDDEPDDHGNDDDDTDELRRRQQQPQQQQPQLEPLFDFGSSNNNDNNNNDDDDDDDEGNQVQRRKQNEQAAMLHSLPGRAFLLLERLIRVHNQIVTAAAAQYATSSNTLQPVHNNNPPPLWWWKSFGLVGHDDLVWLTERFVACQEDFRTADKPASVGLAYHYTWAHRLQSIRQDGLLSSSSSRTPPQQPNPPSTTTLGTVVPAKRPVAFFGPGLYVANNPYMFAPYYGDTGLLVATIPGRRVRVSPGGTNDPTVDTAVGNKLESQYALAEESVLRQSRQGLPLLRFSREVLYPNGTLDPQADDLLWNLHQAFQTVLDEFFNQSVPTVVSRPEPHVSLRSLTRTGRLAGSSSTSAPVTLSPVTATTAAAVSVVPNTGSRPASLSRQSNPGATRTTATVKPLERIPYSAPSGPTSPQPLVVSPTRHPPGRSPTGVLTIAHTSALCGGYTQIYANSTNRGLEPDPTGSNGSIVLIYRFPPGVQQAYHESPGRSYDAVTLAAYLPNTAPGRALLLRLKYAWQRGLLFAVGTTGPTGPTVHSTVPQKSRLVGAPHGFPDPDYLQRANAALDAWHVPRAISHERPEASTV